MIKINVIWIGKNHVGFPESGVQEFVTKIGHMAKLDVRTLEVKTKSKDADGMKKEEAERLLPLLDDKMQVILLDERGQQPDSIQFAKKLEQWVDSGKVPTFVIGGAYGFHESVLQKFPQKISLSNMVMTHQLARVVLLEQMYRALNILKGTEYHK